MNKYTKFIERITLTGKMEESYKAFEYCRKYNFDIRVSGPMPVAKHTVDPSRYRIVAEREIEKP